MYKLLKKLAGVSLFYSLANSIEALSPFFLAILLTRFLTTEDYGIWVLFLSLVGFLRPVVNLTIQDALKMKFYEMDEAKLAAFIVSALYISIAAALLLSIGAVAFGSEISRLISFPASWLTAIVIATYFTVTYNFILAFNQFAERRGHFIALHGVQSLCGFTVIALLVLQGWNWQGVVVGKIAGLVLACLLGLFWVSKELKLSLALPQRAQLLEMIKFGLIYLPTGFGLVAVPLTDRLIISHLLGFSENGLYGVAALFGAALFVGINGFLHAWMPWMFRQVGESKAAYRKEVSVVSISFVLLLPVAGIVFYTVSVVLAPWLIGETFARSFGLIPWAIAGTVAMGYFYHNQAFLHCRKAILPMSISSLTCIVMNAYFSYYGAIYYGVAGVVAATIVAFMVSAVISGIYIVYHYNVFGSLFSLTRRSA